MCSDSFASACAIAEEKSKETPKCLQCGKPMGPVEAAISSTCGKCCRLNHRKAMGKNNAQKNCLLA